MVRRMCGVKLKDRVPSTGLRERLGLDDIISVLHQNRLCMEYEVEGARPRGKPNKTYRDCAKKTVRHINSTGSMPWIIIDGGSR